jgi:hypothetical protein
MIHHMQQLATGVSTFTEGDISLCIDKRVNGIGNAPREPIMTIEKFADKAC